MDEKEFKKLASNSRDWLIYSLLSERSKELIAVEFGNKTFNRTPLKDKIDDFDEKPTGETSVQETVTGKVTLVTDKAVLIGNADRVAWFPKSVIENLDKIVLEKDKTVELVIKDWFKYKIEWKVPQSG